MIRAARLALGILCASAIGTAQGTQQPQGQPPQQGQGQQGQSQQPQQGQGQQGSQQQGQQPQQGQTQKGQDQQPQQGQGQQGSQQLGQQPQQGQGQQGQQGQSQQAPSGQGQQGSQQQSQQPQEKPVGPSSYAKKKTKEEREERRKDSYGNAKEHFKKVAKYQKNCEVDPEARKLWKRYSGLLEMEIDLIIVYSEDLTQEERSAIDSWDAAATAADKLRVSDPSYKAALKKADEAYQHFHDVTRERRKAIEKKLEEGKEISNTPECPSDAIMAPTPVWTTTVVTDGVNWCTFGSAQGVATGLTPTDAHEDLMASAVQAWERAISEKVPSTTETRASTPSSPRASADEPQWVAPHPLASMRPARPAPTSPKTDNPPPASAPEQPGTAEQTPPATDNLPPTGDLLPTPEQVTIDFNEKAAAKEVAENVKQAKAEASAIVKLKWITPDLPGSGEKSAHDEGSDKNPATGRVGEPITTDEPQTYGLASTPGAPSHYRAEIDTPEHSGFVAETTGKPGKAAELASALPAGVKATIDTVQIGGQNHTRVGLDWPRSQQVDPTALAASISRAIGAKLGIDTCRRTKPAPALGPEPASASAITTALPATVIKLRPTVEPGRTR